MYVIREVLRCKPGKVAEVSSTHPLSLNRIAQTSQPLTLDVLPPD
jgi:hypothetical protein